MNDSSSQAYEPGNTNYSPRLERGKFTYISKAPISNVVGSGFASRQGNMTHPPHNQFSCGNSPYLMSWRASNQNQTGKKRQIMLGFFTKHAARVPLLLWGSWVSASIGRVFAESRTRSRRRNTCVISPFTRTFWLTRSNFPLWCKLRGKISRRT